MRLPTRLLLAALLTLIAAPALAQIDEPDRLARCANNRAAVANYDRQIAAMSQPWPDAERRTANADLERVAALLRDYLEADAASNRSLDALETSPEDGLAAANDLYNSDSDKLVAIGQQIVRVGSVYNIRATSLFPDGAVEIYTRLDARIQDDDRRLSAIAAVQAAAQPYRTNLVALSCDRASPVPTGPDSAMPTSSGGCQGFDGRWDGGSYGIMTLAGGSGSYVWKGNTYTIAGSISGRTLTGRYSQPGYPEPKFLSGQVNFTLAADGNSWSGTWTDVDGKPAGNWTGTCLGAP